MRIVVTRTDAPVIVRNQQQVMGLVRQLITLATVSSNLLVCIHYRIKISIHYFYFNCRMCILNIYVLRHFTLRMRDRRAVQKGADV